MTRVAAWVLSWSIVAGVTGCEDAAEKARIEAEYAAQEKAARQAQTKARLAKFQDPARRGPGFALVPSVAKVEAKPGPAHVFVDDVGVATLDTGGKWSLLPMPDDTFCYSLATAPDGTLWVGTTKVYKVEGGKPVRVGEEAAFKAGAFGNHGFISFLHVPADGKVVAASDKRVWRWEGEAWKSWAAKEIGFGTKMLEGGVEYQNPIKDVAVDAKGRVYAMGDHTLKVLDAGEWKTIYDAAGVQEPPYLKAILMRPGELVVPTHFAVMKIDGKDLRLVDRYGTGTPAFADRNHLVSGTILSIGYKQLMRFEVARNHATFVPYKQNVGHVKHSTVDARGRLWLATENGVVIHDGEATTHWAPGTIPQISAQPQVIHVVGSGPDLPKVGPVAKGSIQGRLMKGDAPIANAMVEVCASPSWMLSGASDTPCADAPFRGVAYSKADGTFAIEDVPLNNYGMAAGTGGKWYTTSGATCAGMKAGDVCDVGTMRLSDR